MKVNVINRVLTGLLSCLMWTAVQAGEPLWTITPSAGSNPSQTVPVNATATVNYVVQNASFKPKNLVMLPIVGISQPEPCRLTAKGQAGSSCILSLVITGQSLPRSGIHSGPVLCELNPDGSTSVTQCYQANGASALNITPAPPAGSTISVTPLLLNFVAGNTGVITVTNSLASPNPALNVIATIPFGSNISVQSTTCGASLAIGASCTITFTAPVTEGPTIIQISGSNTNTVNVTVTVVLMATITATPTTSLINENSTEIVTVTNDIGSLADALNLVAAIPAGSNISVQSTTCGPVLAIGASCTITFISGTAEGPTIIPIAGDNTNIENITITVTGQPILIITAPVQQNRIVTVGSVVPLTLTITNNPTGVLNATAITVSNQAGCPTLVVDDTTCVNVAPGATCSLDLTSNDPYAPCAITISGSNTANSPQTLIAFLHLGGLVFEENAGIGKIIIDSAQEFSSPWTNVLFNIAGTASLTDGVANTNAIVASAACTGSPLNCAAQRCRNIAADWYLPARDELVSVAGAFCTNPTEPCEFGDFLPNGYYWTSSQRVLAPVTNAFQVLFPSGFATSTVQKTIPQPVRCIRAFP